jgi:GNAT superfamily N-acetyltransferase
MQPFIVLTHAERPELKDQTDAFGDIWPEFIFHDETAELHYHHTESSFADFNLYLCDEGGELVAAGVAIPIVWDGSVADLPAGWDAALERGVRNLSDGLTPTALCALGAMVSKRHQGRGFSKFIIRAMKSAAAGRGLRALVAPVRPSLKSQYPLTAMGSYIRWRRADGSPFDPWLRVHWREGARVLRVAPRSMVIRGTVGEWEQWTKMRFPGSGSYVVPGGLQPITVDCERDEGCYEEPNVWMLHNVE